jgi:hypothetical protein
MATKPPARPPLLRLTPATAATTRIRVVIDDLIHLIRRLELTASATMPGLPTRRAPLTLLAHQFLGPSPRLRPPLRPRLRRIRRRRLRTRSRVLTRLLLQPLQTILMQLDPTREVENELHTRLTPRSIDRLRLRTVHDRKNRCNKQESSPPAPTTERLRVVVTLHLLSDPRNFAVDCRELGSEIELLPNGQQLPDDGSLASRSLAPTRRPRGRQPMYRTAG